MMYRRLPPEVKEKMEEALKIGVEKGYGYHRVWRMLKENGIEISKSTVRNYYYKRLPERLKKRYLPRELRIKLYQKVLELRRQGLGCIKIKKKIEELYGISLSPSVINYWYRNIRNPFNGCRVPSIEFLKPSPELAYIIGVVSGDGYAIKKENYLYEIGANAKDKEFIKEFSTCLGKVLKRTPPRLRLSKDGMFRVCVRSKTLYEILKKPIDIDKITPFVEHCKDCMRSFLRGAFNSEGCVTKDGCIRYYNTNIELLQYVKKILNTLKIKATEPRIYIKRGPFF